MNEHDAVLFETSVAVQVTVVAPVGAVNPDGGRQMEVAPGQLSIAAGGM
jgi:hypothetical protein